MRPRLSRVAYTLIEILVVIAIIAVLAALLLPMISRAKEHANRALCQSNLRQLMLAFVAFAHDHDDQLPGSYWDSKFPTDANLDHRDWLRGDPTYWSSAPAGGTLFHYVVGGEAVYRCPSREVDAPAPSAFFGPKMGSNGKYDYVSMLDFTGARRSHIADLSQLTFPGGQTQNWPTPILVEGDPFQLNGVPISSWHARSDPIAHLHDGGGFYAALDGSVNWIDEPSGGCSAWLAQAPSGRWVGLSAFPFYWGQWNRL